uniref:Uncharacterized protein n=1 Tax=Amphimedon queenslandica TaxID=400682 RepID=A0A1X7TH44_AMPQE
LKKFKEAWSFASALDSEDCWRELRTAALYHFDTETAILASQQMKDVSLVYSLKEISIETLLLDISLCIKMSILKHRSYSLNPLNQLLHLICSGIYFIGIKP